MKFNFSYQENMLQRIMALSHHAKCIFMGHFVFKGLMAPVGRSSTGSRVGETMQRERKKTTFPSEKIVFPLGKWLFCL
jgi:hypothetical protein